MHVHINYWLGKVIVLNINSIGRFLELDFLELDFLELRTLSCALIQGCIVWYLSTACAAAVISGIHQIPNISCCTLYSIIHVHPGILAVNHSTTPTI